MGLDPRTPVRIGFEITRLGVRAGVEAVRLPLRLISNLVAHGHHDSAVAAPPVRARPEPAVRPSRPAEAPAEPAPAAEQAVEIEVPPPAPAPERPLQPEEEPPHVDTEPELVAEFAEPGAEEGAHAEIRVNEPWEGYSRMKVAEILARIPTASAAELAVIQLYESTHRNRKSVLAAIQRREKELANLPENRG